MKQEKIINYIKSIIVDYIIDIKHLEEMKQKNKDININDFIVNIINDSNNKQNYKLILDILYEINKIDNIVYNEYDIIVYKSTKDAKPGKNTINIKFLENGNYFVI